MVAFFSSRGVLSEESMMMNRGLEKQVGWVKMVEGLRSVLNA